MSTTNVADLVAAAGQAASKAHNSNVTRVTTRPKAQRLSERAGEQRKLALLGHSGQGKTHALLGPILCEERLRIVEVDFGGSGLATIEGLLDPRFGYPGCINRPELLDNVCAVTIGNYEQFMELLDDPSLYFPADFDPTVDVLEGFSNFQTQHIDEYVLGKNPQPRKDSSSIPELREVGLWAEQTDWGGIKRATLRALSKFLFLPGPKGNMLPKIVTFLEAGKLQADKITGDVQKGFLLEGKAASLVQPSFDAVIECYTEKDLLGQQAPKYKYRCQPGGAVVAKNRSMNLPPEMDADPVRLWKAVRGV